MSIPSVPHFSRNAVAFLVKSAYAMCMAFSASFAQISMNLSGSLLHVLLDRAIGCGIGSGVLVCSSCKLSHGNQGRSVVFAADAERSNRPRNGPPRSFSLGGCVLPPPEIPFRTICRPVFTQLRHT